MLRVPDGADVVLADLGRLLVAVRLDLHLFDRLGLAATGGRVLFHDRVLLVCTGVLAVFKIPFLSNSELNNSQTLSLALNSQYLSRYTPVPYRSAKNKIRHIVKGRRIKKTVSEYYCF